VVILYKVQWMSLKLKELRRRGHPIDAAVLEALSPYRKDHINRLGYICSTSIGRCRRSIRRSISIYLLKQRHKVTLARILRLPTPAD